MNVTGTQTPLCGPPSRLRSLAQASMFSLDVATRTRPVRTAGQPHGETTGHSAAPAVSETASLLTCDSLESAISSSIGRAGSTTLIARDTTSVSSCSVSRCSTARSSRLPNSCACASASRRRKASSSSPAISSKTRARSPTSSAAALLFRALRSPAATRRATAPTRFSALISERAIHHASRASAASLARPGGTRHLLSGETCRSV
jgi:hypothetical protein